MIRQYPRKLDRSDAVLSAVTADAESSPIDIQQNRMVTICVKASGGTVAGELSVHISTVASADDVDFTSAASPTTNPYAQVSLIDTSGNIVTGNQTISAAGIYYYDVNWEVATFLGVKMENVTNGTFTVDVIGTTNQ